MRTIGRPTAGQSRDHAITVLADFDFLRKKLAIFSEHLCFNYFIPHKLLFLLSQNRPSCLQFFGELKKIITLTPHPEMTAGPLRGSQSETCLNTAYLEYVSIRTESIQCDSYFRREIVGESGSPEGLTQRWSLLLGMKFCPKSKNGPLCSPQ
jgi:hypothetical protein